MSAASKRLLHWLGNAVAIVGILFVFQHLAEYRLELKLDRFDGEDWAVLVILTIFYTSANFLLGFAWWHLLAGLGATISKNWALRTYGTSQLAKYLPGNVFHIAGRQALGLAEGIAAWPLAKSQIWELSLLSVAGGLFAFLALPWLFPKFSESWASLVFCLAVGTIGLSLYRLPGHGFGWAFGLQVIFLACSGAIFAALIYLVSISMPTNPAIWIKLAGAFVIAWLAGFLTPGAPAGLGVRELVLLFLLKGQIHETDLLLAVVLGRIITVAGDLLFFLIAATLKQNKFCRNPDHLDY